MLEAIVIAVVIAALVGILLVAFVGPLLVSVGVPVAVMIGNAFVKWGWALGVIAGILWFLGGPPIFGLGKH